MMLPMQSNQHTFKCNTNFFVGKLGSEQILPKIYDVTGCKCKNFKVVLPALLNFLHPFCLYKAAHCKICLYLQFEKCDALK